MAEEGSFDLYWRHFDMTKEEYIGWLIISFHFSHFFLLWLAWSRENLQILMFTFLGCLMLYAEKLNELLAQQKWISRQNYFDSSGMFFTIVIGAPVVMHLLILLFKWIKTSADTMIAVKRKELKLKLKAKKESQITENDQTGLIADNQKKND